MMVLGRGPAGLRRQRGVKMSYNGWANYPTWCVALWLDNDEGTYNAVRDDIGHVPEN